MITVSVKEALKALESAKKELGEKQFSVAISRELNESILQGRTAARSAIKNAYNIPQRYLAESILIGQIELILRQRYLQTPNPFRWMHSAQSLKLLHSLLVFPGAVNRRPVHLKSLRSLWVQE